MSFSHKEPEEQFSKARAFFHLFPVALLCLVMGWYFRYDLHRDANPFLLPVLLLPVAVPGLRNRYKFGLGGVILGFLALGFFVPIAVRPPHVIPKWGPDIPPLTVNGINPRTFLAEHLGALKGVESPETPEALETILYELSFGKVQLVLSPEGQIVASYFRYTGDIGLAKPWEQRHTFPQDGDFVGQAPEAVEQAISELSVENNWEREHIGRSWIIGHGDSPVVIHHGTELTVHGTKIFQNTSLVGEVGKPLSEIARERFRSSYYSDGGLYFEDYAFQSKPVNGQLFVYLDEERKVQRIWSVYPLPMWIEDELYLNPWEPSTDG